MRNGKRSAMIVVAIAFSIAVWAPFGTAGVEAQPEGSNCSNLTLRGHYGGSFDGQIPAGFGTVLLRGLVVTHFDGPGTSAKRNSLRRMVCRRPAGSGR